MKTSASKLFILGIDGATFDIINPLLGGGELPHMQRVIERGVHGILRSTIPSLSAPAWVAFMTGKNPGHYGSYHFRKINVDTYDNIYNLDLINSSAFSGDTVFDYLGRMGYRVGMTTIPVTYPPWELNGFMISGYPCPDPDENPNFTFPWNLGEELRENLNWTEKENSQSIPKAEMRGATNPDDVLAGGITLMNRATDQTLRLMDRFESDVTVLVWGAIDRAQHTLWKYHDPSHILHRRENGFQPYIQHLYRHADHLLGKIMDHIGPEARLIIVSDHGAGPKQGSHFHLNAWLYEHGYLKTTLKHKLVNNPIIPLLKAPMRRMVINMGGDQRRKVIRASQMFAQHSLNFNKTLAYRFPIDEQTEGLVINLRGRQPLGIVGESEYESLRMELIERLSAIVNPVTGERVVKKCYRREDLYSGDKVNQAPDILLLLENNYFPGSRSSGKIFSQIQTVYLEAISGSHRPEGIFMACGPGFSQGKLKEDASILDVAPTVLYALGEKIPRDIEGRIISDAFSRDCLQHPPQFVDRKANVEFPSQGLSSRDQESMQNKLRELGYL